MKEYHGFFEPYFYVHAAVQLIYAASLVLSLVLMVVAFLTWAKFSSSRRWLYSAYLLSFVVPFLLLLIAPYKQVINFEGAERKLCEDMLTVGNKLLGRGRFECEMPGATMCSRPSSTWTNAVKGALDQCGVMRNETTGTCPFAVDFAKQALQRNPLKNSDLAPAVQQLCKAEAACFPCIAPEDAANGAEETCSNVGLAVAGPRTVRERCARCFVPVTAWRVRPEVTGSPPTVSLTAQQWEALQEAGVGTNTDWRVCSQICAPLLVPQLANQYAAQLSGKQNFCVSEEAFSMVSTFTGLALHYEQAYNAIGIYQSVMTMVTLFPASFSLMFGSIKGATLCKTLLPWSRLPGYMIGAAIVFCLPTFTALLASIYQLVGNYYCMAAFLSLLLSLLVWLPMRDLSQEEADAGRAMDKRGVLAPQSHSDATAGLTLRGRLSMLFNLVALLFLALFIYFAATELNQLEQRVVKSVFKRELQDLVLIVLGIALDIFGKANVAFLFCADRTNEIIAFVSQDDDGDRPLSVTSPSGRQETMNSLCLLSWWWRRRWC